MKTVTLNNIIFTVEEDCGEYWFQSGVELQPKTLARCIRDFTFLDSTDISWYSPKHGNFSIKGDNARFALDMLTATTIDSKLDILFEEA